MTSSGIESATSRYVAQRLKHCATAAPIKYGVPVRKLFLGTCYAQQFIFQILTGFLCACIYQCVRLIQP